MNDAQKVIVFALHQKIETFKTKDVGTCIICDKPVYFATNKAHAGEVTIEDLPKLKTPKYIGIDCVAELIEKFRFFLLLSLNQQKEYKRQYMQQKET